MDAGKKDRRGSGLPAGATIMVEETTRRLECKFSNLTFKDSESLETTVRKIQSLSPKDAERSVKQPTPEPESPSLQGAKHLKGSGTTSFLEIEESSSSCIMSFNSVGSGTQSDSDNFVGQAPSIRPSTPSGPRLSEQVENDSIPSTKPISETKSKPHKSSKSKAPQDNAKRMRRIRKDAKDAQKSPLREEALRKIIQITALEDLGICVDKCIAYKVSGERCTNPRRHPTDGGLDVMKRLGALNLREDWEEIYDALTSLVETWMCGIHWGVAITQLMALNGRMVNWASQENKKAADDAWKVSRLTLVQPWLEGILRDSEEHMKNICEKLDKDTNAQHDVITENLTVGMTRSPYQRKFVRHFRKSFDCITVQRAIRDAVQKHMDQRERHRGHIYIYESPSAVGYVKIGVSISTDLDTRMKSWEKQCGHDVREYLRIEVKTAYRVELLVHTALGKFRMKEPKCSGCGKEHTEWFKVKPDHAAKVIRKYAAWAATKPYQYCPENKKWLLNTERIGNHEIEKLCDPDDISDDDDDQ